MHKVPATDKAWSSSTEAGGRDRQQVIIGLYELQTAPPHPHSTHSRPFKFLSLPVLICQCRPRTTWMSQIVRDTGLTAADAWAIADDRSTWTVLWCYDPQPVTRSE